MKLIATSVERQVGVSVGVLLVVLFGLLSLWRTPIQLTPEVSRPEITIQTDWPGASPEEVEKEIILRQEDELKSVEGVEEMKSESQDSSGRIVLTFTPGTDMDAALLKVSNRLNQVRDIPEDAERPVISTVNTDDRPIAWFILKPLAGNSNPIYSYQLFTEDHVKARFERVPGVARSNVIGGREPELQVVVDPEKLSAIGLTLGELIRALDSENVNISAGSFDEGKRRYIVRTLAELTAPGEVEAIALPTASGQRLFVGDVAEARFGYEQATVSVRQNGEPAMAVNVQRESGTNVLEVMAGLKLALRELNEGVLAEEGLVLRQVYDETEYIESAIDLVLQNLWVGGLLAVTVLLLFLRSLAPTLIVATAIPISVIGTFIVMTLFGRTLNVISLAGLAFAVGMVVDNAIVVLENIYRHRQLGKEKKAAAIEATGEVWGAVLSSTLTTIAVFLPILFIVQETGQLFRDIAIAICAAVGLSLVISITVIPSAAALLLGRGAIRSAGKSSARRPGPAELFGLVALAGRFSEHVANTVYRVSRSALACFAVVLLFTAAALGGAWLLMPKPEYLPTGNRNLLIGLLLPPPGYNVAELTRIGQGLEGDFAPLWQTDYDDRGTTPAITHFFYVARGRQIFMGVRARDPRRVRELIPFMQQRLGKVPGMIAIVSQTSLFESGLTGGRSIEVEFSGTDLPRLVEIGARAFGMVRQAVPGAQVRPVPSLDLGNPEIRVLPDRVRLADLGISARDLGIAVDALLDGTRASTVNVAGNEIDLTVMGAEHFASRTQDFEKLLLRSPDGQQVPLGALARVLLVAGPEQINHAERQRTITLEVRPPEEIPLEAAMEMIEQQVLEPLRQQGVLGSDLRVRLAGTADKLRETFDVLKWNFLLALVITYLLMAALFESFFYPFVIMFSVPLAMAGGFLGLWLVSHLLAYQALDVLTMLGFIILVGTVVNNAILIVHQALNFMREGQLESREALRESVRGRVRPIFMSVGTSVFGMLPLVLFPGAGSELYRGLGSVVVGGLVVSTLFTLLLVPALFSLLLSLRTASTGRAAKGVPAPAAEEAPEKNR
ncbi:acriflavin resistance protein [Desulfuromonas versatilis]|uniref:Acriflavin resistance protein n=1 Tax=Desulfuromonas versatilis TaxID=2802975 RepID=A0ABN6DUX2_9BACT|nr:efflux RND transporter permease subunit [Desulfuromonas versatilis]BCR03918.1 acriflavin resistance protein [Desulfuromonas versatilis]